MSIRTRAPWSSGATDATVPISVTMPVNIILLPSRPFGACGRCRSARRASARSRPGIDRVSSSGEAMPSRADRDIAAEQHDAVDQTVLEEGRAPCRRRPRPGRWRCPARPDPRAAPAARRGLERLGGEQRTPACFAAPPCARVGLRARRDEQRHLVRRRDQLRGSGSRAWRSSTMRTGERSSSPGSRTVSSGSSASAVPMPTRMASERARISCTWRRAISPVIGDLARALARPIMPSAESASFRITSGRFFDDRIR